MSHWAMRRCSSICQAVCGEPGILAPRSSGGISAKASRQEAWASLVSRFCASWWRRVLRESGEGVDFARGGVEWDFFAGRELVDFFCFLAMIASLAFSFCYFT